MAIQFHAFGIPGWHATPEEASADPKAEVTPEPNPEPKPEPKPKKASEAPEED